jgi:hypothetical protein
MTGRVMDSAKASDQFLWDLRRTVADMIAKSMSPACATSRNRTA